MARAIFDLTILGAGPTGLFATYYAGFRGLKTKLIDSLHDVGGQVTALYPEKYIYDVPGLPRILGRDLIRNLAVQAQQYNPTIRLEEHVHGLRREQDTLVLVSDRGEHWTKALLIACGIGMFRPRTFGKSDLDRFAGHGLAYAVKATKDSAGKRLLIVGGGDTAVDWALNLLPYAASVTLIHRRRAFRAHAASVEQLLGSRARILTPYELASLDGTRRLQRAVVRNTQTGASETLAVDQVLACLGFHVEPGPLAEWGLTLEENGIVVNTKMETNLPGIYSAGDVIRYPGNLKLIATGFGEAATAVNNAATYINPKLALFPGHSSVVGP